jgi:hypothetical protein
MTPRRTAVCKSPAFAPFDDVDDRDKSTRVGVGSVRTKLAPHVRD